MREITRDTYECVSVGDDIEITVLEIKGNTVRLGFSAPESVSVQPSEKYALTGDCQGSCSIF